MNSPRIHITFDARHVHVTRMDIVELDCDSLRSASYFEGKFQMSNCGKLYLCVALAAVSATSAQAGTKVSAACMYESGQNGNQTISDFTIWNTASFPIPKGTVVTKDRRQS